MVAHQVPRLRELSVQQALEWAFADERVRIETDPARHVGAVGLPGIGMEYILGERMRLGGVRIDTSIGRSLAHEDAEVIAAVLEQLPSVWGGIGMAVRIAELARARITPDWMPEAVPLCVPIATRQTKYGPRGVEEVCETITHRHRGRKVKREVRWCPVIYRPTPAQIASARRGYSEWWSALLHLRTALSVVGLRKHRITDALPPATPWRKKGIDEPADP